MSFFDSIESAVSTLKSEIGKELTSVDSNLSIMLSKAAGDVDNEFEMVYGKIRHILDSVEGEIETKAANVESLLVSAKNEIEQGAETAFHAFVNKTEDEVRKIKGLTKESVSALETAGAYIKNAAENDVKHAMQAAKASFDAAKAAFQRDINAIVTTAISKTKEGVDALINDAKEGGEKLSNLKTEVEGEIKSKFKTMDDDLISLKKRFVDDMDEVVAFGRKEANKVEAKFESLAARAKDTGTVIAAIAISIAIAAALGIIFMKEKRVQTEFDQWKRERVR